MFGSTFSKKHFKKKGPDLEQTLKDLVGHVVQCEDGVFRRVVEAVEPVGGWQAKSGLIIINEHDPQSNMGHYVHMLTVQCVLMGLSPPSTEAKQAASRLWRSMVIANAKDLHESQRKGKLPLDFND